MYDWEAEDLILSCLESSDVMVHIDLCDYNGWGWLPWCCWLAALSRISNA